MATFVLVHGGGHGGWCYQPLARLLRSAGHEVYTPTLTGVGERRHLVTADVDLDLHIQDVVNVLRYEDLDDVILVGHSYGGLVITGAADRALDRIGQLVYLDASIPEDGESLAILSPVLMERAHSGARVVDGVELVLWPEDYPPEFFGINDPMSAAWARERLTPHPWRTFQQPIRLNNGEAVKKIPRTNINCTETLRIRPVERRQRAFEADRVFEIDTGHDLMITEPQAVADILLSGSGT
jgi:pimeloyl-ACP methyl ester carboxylesterase